MAKTMRRPVDKLERQQRLARKTHKYPEDRPGRIPPHQWEEFQDEDADTVEDYSVQSETY